jgi:predicted transposase/invertase (TIGR01784 family)
VDIRLVTTSGRQIDIEIQVLPYRAILPRLVYYTSKIMAEQMKSGFDYAALRQTICVVITDHTLFPNEASCLNHYELRNRKSGSLFTDLQEYVTIELSKLPEEDDGEPVWPFLRFFKCRTEEEFKMLAKRHPEVQGPVEEYQRISWSKRRRLLADYWEKQRRDARAATDYAREEGRAAGLEAGRAESQQALAEKDREIAELRRKLEGR